MTRDGPSSALGCWWPLSRPKGLRKALFRLCSPWPSAGQLHGLTRYYVASDVPTQLNTHALGVPGRRVGWTVSGLASTEQNEDRK